MYEQEQWQHLHEKITLRSTPDGKVTFYFVVFKWCCYVAKGTVGDSAPCPNFDLVLHKWNLSHCVCSGSATFCSYIYKWSCGCPVHGSFKIQDKPTGTTGNKGCRKLRWVSSLILQLLSNKLSLQHLKTSQLLHLDVTSIYRFPNHSLSSKLEPFIGTNHTVKTAT